MKNFKMRAASALLAATLMTGTAPTAVMAASTGDLSGHWAQKVMEQLASEGVLNGDGTGNYLPDNSMKRAEYSAMLNRIMGLTEMSDSISKYSDVSENAWYHDDMAKAIAKGYITGTSDTTISPEDTITREQGMVMIARILGLDTENADLSVLDAFGDAAEISDWAKGSVAAMVKDGFVAGSDGKILPSKSLTRAEGSTLMNSTKDQLKAAVGNKDTNTETPLADGTFKDGVYTGTGAGYGGTLKVQMTVESGKITKLEIVSNSETGSYLTRAKTIIDKILEKQTTDGVDTVSGATKSSNGILTAVKACISQAQGGADTSKTGSTGGGGGGAGASTKPAGEDFLGALTDGTYTGSATGYSGTTKVTVIVSGGKITAVNVDSNGDTSSYFSRATAVIDKIITAQSTSVDAVSGATYSSWGIINAVADALKGAVPDTAKTYQAANWSEFSTALAKAADGDTVKLTADITDAGQIDGISSATLTVNKSITVDGQNHTITANAEQVTQNTTDSEGNITATEKVDASFCFDVATAQGIVMKDMVIDGASFNSKLGGAMYVENDAELSLNNVTFKNCKAGNTGAGNGGAAIYAEPHRGTGAAVTATNCTFENNIVNDGTTGRGGAVSGYNAAIVLDGCTFTGNKAGYGGAVAAAGSTNLTVKNCTFEASNDAVYGGDDIYVFDGYTFYKKAMGADSAVNAVISGNTYNGTDGSDFTEYRVVMGRVLDSVNDITNGSVDKETSQPTPIALSAAGSGNVFTAGHDLTFTAADYDRTGSPTENIKTYRYVMMNIPYAEFYAADVNNDQPVDAFTSATKAKIKTGTLSGGSYYDDNADDGDYDYTKGVRFPVLVSEDYDDFLTDKGTVTDASSLEITVSNRGQTNTTTYAGIKALYNQPEYSYYEFTDTSESKMPDYYKILTVNDQGEASFSKTYGIAQTVNGVAASFTTETSYGDYQLNFSEEALESYFSHDTDDIYGVVVHTKEGSDYGLRHLENIWLGVELAWSTGFTEAVHNCPTSSDHYEAMMGQTITGVTYYTSNGIFDIPTQDIYVPIKNTVTMEVTAAENTANTSPATINGLPDDYNVTAKVYDASGDDITSEYGFSYSDEALTWTKAPLPGTYTFQIEDSAGKYVSYSTDFEMQSSATPAVYDDENLRIKAGEDVSAADFSNYMSNITSVKVGATDYAASGRGAVVIIQEDGTVDLTAAPFADKEEVTTYDIEVTSAGYTNALKFTVTIPSEQMAG